MTKHSGYRSVAHKKIPNCSCNASRNYALFPTRLLIKRYQSKFKYDNTRRAKHRSGVSENPENWNLFAHFNSYEYRLFGVIINAFVIITFSRGTHFHGLENDGRYNIRSVGMKPEFAYRWP